MNKMEKIYKEIRDKGDIEKTSIICSNLFIQTDFNFRVFVSIQIPVFTDFDPYKNESLVMTLNVEKNGQIEKWLELKKSSMNDGGFGVFAAREFSANEFVTVYLGKNTNTATAAAASKKLHKLLHFKRLWLQFRYDRLFFINPPKCKDS